MASNNITQYEAEHGTTVEQDLADCVSETTVQEVNPQTPVKRKGPPSEVLSVNSSLPQTVSSAGPINEEEITLVRGAVSTTINAAGDGTQQF